MATEKNYKQVLGDHNIARPLRSYTEVEHYLAAVHDHAAEVRGWKTNGPRNAIEVVLENSNAEIPPLYMVPKRGKGPFLELRLQQLLNEMRSGVEPTWSAANEVWDMIDPR